MELEPDKQSLCSLTVAAHPDREAFHQPAVLATVPANSRYHSFSERSKNHNLPMSGLRAPKHANPVQFVPLVNINMFLCHRSLLRQYHLLMGQFDVQGSN